MEIMTDVEVQIVEYSENPPQCSYCGKSIRRNTRVIQRFGLTQKNQYQYRVRDCVLIHKKCAGKNG